MMEFQIATQMQLITIAIAVMAFFVVVVSIAAGILVYSHIRKQEEDLRTLKDDSAGLWEKVIDMERVRPLQ